VSAMYEMPQTSMPPQLDFIRMPSQTVTWEPARVGLRPVVLEGAADLRRWNALADRGHRTAAMDQDGSLEASISPPESCSRCAQKPLKGVASKAGNRGAVALGARRSASARRSSGNLKVTLPG
jgi:hypothetical protein